MYYPILGLAFVVIFFSLMLLFVILGQHLGKKKPPTAVLGITEGAVFTLMALLVAFTFSSAGERYDHRRTLIIDEANAISTAYLRLSVLQRSDQLIIKKDFLDYVACRLAIYQALPDIKKAAKEQRRQKEIQTKLWADAVTASERAGAAMIPMLILPAINTMFDIASTRAAYTYFHPHYMIFVLLMLVALLSALLTGYTMAGKEMWGSLHVMIFVFITAITVYVIIDLEYPRLGIIKETQFDHLLVEVQKNMVANSG